MAPLGRVRRHCAPLFGGSGRAAGSGDRARGRSGLRRHARGGGRGGGRVDPGDGGDPARRRRARLPPRRWTAPRDEVAGERLLRLQRRCPGHREGEARRAARPLRRPGRPSRRRSPGAPLRRCGRDDGLLPRVGPLALSRDWFRRRDGGGERNGHLDQRTAGAAHRTGALAGRDSGACSAPGRVVRAGRDRQPARCRRARLGSAGAPFSDDDGDGRGGPTGRSHGTSIRRGAVARDGRRRLCGLPGGAARLGSDMACRGASGGAREAAGGVAGPLGGRCPSLGRRPAARPNSKTGRASRPIDRSARPRPRETVERSSLSEPLGCRLCRALPASGAGGGRTMPCPSVRHAPRRRQKRRRPAGRPRSSRS